MSILIFASCDDDTKIPTEAFSIEIKDAKKNYKAEDVLELSIKNKKNKTIESVSYTLDSENIGASETASIALNHKKLGRHFLRAKITADGKTYEVRKEFVMMSSVSPKLYTYKILDEFPHDIAAYTQGLEFENDTLYESTGQRKQSTLRKTDYKTGKALKMVPLADQYFGEGLTILNNKIYQLTWQGGRGFIYDLHSLEQKGSFVYSDSKEGWGLCNDGTKIYKSDGTEKIWILNSETLAEEDYIEMYTNTAKIKAVNELEWVEGRIFANIYQKDAIAIVNPVNGAVEGVIDLSTLKDNVTKHDKLDVLNGIAYKGEENILYVTGKNWDKLFKIEVVRK
jgi:glutamine cyclotransferase